MFFRSVPSKIAIVETLLERERAFYAAHEVEWAAAHRGRFVVVKGDRLLGTFDSIEQALAAGAASVGLDSFLVRRLGERQEEVNITSADSRVAPLRILTEGRSRPSLPSSNEAPSFR